MTASDNTTPLDAAACALVRQHYLDKAARLLELDEHGCTVPRTAGLAQGAVVGLRTLGAHFRGEREFSGFLGAQYGEMPPAMCSDVAALLYTQMRERAGEIGGERADTVAPQIVDIVSAILGKPVQHLNVLAEALATAMRPPVAVHSTASGIVGGAAYPDDPLFRGLAVSCEPNAQLGFLPDGTALLIALEDVPAGEQLRVARWPWAASAHPTAMAEVSSGMRSARWPGLGGAATCVCPRCQGAALDPDSGRAEGWRFARAREYTLSLHPILLQKHVPAVRSPAAAHVNAALKDTSGASAQDAARLAARALGLAFVQPPGEYEAFAERYAETLATAKKLREHMGFVERVLVDLHCGRGSPADAMDFVALTSWAEAACDPVLRTVAEAAVERARLRPADK